MYDVKKRLARAVYLCACCGKEAATVELFAGKAGKGDQGGGAIVISGFIGRTEEVVTHKGLTLFRDAISHGDPARLHESYAPFYCRSCGKCYCIDHWRSETRYDDDIYDCTYGICPEGHRRMIDD